MSKYLSVVISLNNEGGNIDLLYKKLKKTLVSLNKSYEIIFVDDGSTDNTYSRLHEIYCNDQTINIIKFKKRYGQNSGLAAGFNFARGDVIVTLDGDLQHDPEDIPKLLDKLSLGYDIINGRKKENFGNLFTKKIPSLIAKEIIRRIFSTNIVDVSSTFRAYRKDILKDIKISGVLHNFIPFLISKNKISILEIEVSCKRRIYGRSHYGVSMLWTVTKDIIFLWLERNFNINCPKKLSYQIDEINSHS